MEIQRPSRRTIIIATSILAILALVFFSALLFSTQKTKKTTLENTPPKASALPPVGSNDRPSPTMSHVSQEEKVLLDRFENREPLSQSDTQAVASILKPLAGEKSGTIHESASIRIDYVASADIFQVEILTTSVEQAKIEGAAWFESQGLSHKGVCEYPVQFYLNFDIGRELKEAGTPFSPLAPGC